MSEIGVESEGESSRGSARDGTPRYIAVEGPIGVGKTTLARRLAVSLHCPMLLEPSAENPFLDRFYREGGHHALPTQLFFLLHRARRMADLETNPAAQGAFEGESFTPRVIADFLFEKDQLFAEITLDAHELELYRQIHASLAVHAPKPDLVVYLQAPERVLLERIRRRGVAYEQHISPGYLSVLIDAYTRFFHFYDGAPLLIVNAAEIDLAHDDQHFRALLDQILNMGGTRRYFNPHPTLI